MALSADRTPHLELLALNRYICLKAAALPKRHKDPCDRFIIASALMRQSPVVTADARFKAFGVQVLN